MENLGVYLDNHMNMSVNTSEFVRCCYFHIHHIGQINKFLPSQTRERVVNALVTTRLDYCNSLLYSTVDKNFARLQRLQNTAARLIMRVPKYSNITPVLKELHWLPVRECVCFKIGRQERSTVVDQYTCVALFASTRRPEHFAQKEPNS